MLTKLIKNFYLIFKLLSAATFSSLLNFSRKLDLPARTQHFNKTHEAVEFPVLFSSAIRNLRYYRLTLSLKYWFTHFFKDFQPCDKKLVNYTPFGVRF